MIIFGLTGGIASGKSTVTKTLHAQNIPIVDADLVARDVVVPGSLGLNMIIESFGPEYLLSDGNLDRPKLAKKVFSDSNSLARINQILTPLIQDEVDIRFENLRRSNHLLVGYDAALICEQGHADRYRPLIVVMCPQDIQLARLMKRNSLTEAEAMSRIMVQMPTEKKVSMADYVVNTSGSIEDSVAQTLNIISLIKKSL